MQDERVVRYIVVAALHLHALTDCCLFLQSRTSLRCKYQKCHMTDKYFDKLVTASHTPFSFCTSMVSSGTKRAAFEGKLCLKHVNCWLIEVYIVALFLASQVGRHIYTYIRYLLNIYARQLCIIPCEWASSVGSIHSWLNWFFLPKVGNRCHGSR